MTDGQARVLGLLVAIALLEVAFSQPAQTAIHSVLTGKFQFPTSIGALSAPAYAIIGWTVGGLLLIALAGPAPSMATWIAVLLLIYVLMAHSGPIGDAVNKAIAGMGALGGH